jgi:hypothetical protein
MSITFMWVQWLAESPSLFSRKINVSTGTFSRTLLWPLLATLQYYYQKDKSDEFSSLTILTNSSGLRIERDVLT